MRGWPAIAFSIALLAGCIQGPSSDSLSATSASSTTALASLRDATGDAFDDGAVPAAAVVCAIPTACATSPMSLPTPTATPAPYFDLTGLGIEERGTDLELTLTVAKLDAAFPQLDANGHRYAQYRACILVPNGAAARCAEADVYTHAGTMHAFGAFLLPDPSLNEWGFAKWAVPVVVTPGAPATIAFTVPKAYAFLANETPAIEKASASVEWWAPIAAAPRPHGAMTMHAAPPLGHEHQHLVPDDPTEVADVLDAAPATIALAPDHGAMPASTEHVLDAAPGNFFGEGSRFDEPGLDILSVDVNEDPTGVNMVVKLAKLDALPAYDTQFLLMIGVQGKDVYEMGWLKERGRGYGYAGHCISFACTGDHQDGFLSPHDAHDHAVMETPFTLTPGAPATLTVHAPFSAFPTLAKGDVANWFWLVTQYADTDQYWGSYGSEDHGDLHKMEFIDQRTAGEPHVFAFGNEEPADEHHHG